MTGLNWHLTQAVFHRVKFRLFEKKQKYAYTHLQGNVCSF